MNKTPFIRWPIFLLIGLPFQFVVMAIYPLLHLYWRLFVYEKKTQTLPVHEQIPRSEGIATRASGFLLNNPDNHNAFSMYGFIDRIGLSLLLDKDHNFIRRYEDNGNHQQDDVSGDCVISWAFAMSLFENKYQAPVMIEMAADAYLKNLGTLSYDAVSKGDVSNRCNNFGLNYCPDSDTLKLGQPMAGPQYYTNAAIFALASQHSKFYKVVFWVHWILLGGWYWAFSPMIHTKSNKLSYVRDMTMKALYVQLQVFGPKWWIIKPMEKITYEINSARNDLHYAMLGHTPGPLPETMSAWFSQEENASSTRSDRMSAYIPDAINQISQKSRNKSW